MSSITDQDDITRGTANVFQDLGYSDAAERQTKTRLALAVNELLKARKLNPREIAELLHVPQPKVSALANYRLDQFSGERLMEFLTSLDQDCGNHLSTPSISGSARAHCRLGGLLKSNHPKAGRLQLGSSQEGGSQSTLSRRHDAVVQEEGRTRET